MSRRGWRIWRCSGNRIPKTARNATTPAATTAAHGASATCMTSTTMTVARAARVHGGDDGRRADQEVAPQPRPGGPMKHVAGHQATLVVMMAGGEVGLQARRDRQVGTPQPVHRQHQLGLLAVGVSRALPRPSSRHCCQRPALRTDAPLVLADGERVIGPVLPGYTRTCAPTMASPMSRWSSSQGAGTISTKNAPRSSSALGLS
jgi:hypothetical protein